MSFEEKGAYVTLLIMQFNRGHMTEHMIGHTVGQLWDNIKDKFIQDDSGLWYNERLDKEKIKRQKYTESRRNNKLGINQHTLKKSEIDRGHTTSHMENENETENKDEIKNIIDYMNEVLGTKYKHNSKSTVQHINARLNEGFTVDDFYFVVQKKTQQWGNDLKMAQYLRPQTLFSTKFESYLNQITPQEKSRMQSLIERTIAQYGQE